MQITCSQSDRQISLSGQVSLYNATEWLQRTDKLLRQFKGQEVILNLSRINDADSAILTLMLSWLRIAKTLGITVAYKQVPSHIAKISVLYGLWDLLPITSEGS